VIESVRGRVERRRGATGQCPAEGAPERRATGVERLQPGDARMCASSTLGGRRTSTIPGDGARLGNSTCGRTPRPTGQAGGVGPCAPRRATARRRGGREQQRPLGRYPRCAAGGATRRSPRPADVGFHARDVRVQSACSEVSPRGEKGAQFSPRPPCAGNFGGGKRAGRALGPGSDAGWPAEDLVAALEWVHRRGASGLEVPISFGRGAFSGGCQAGGRGAAAGQPRGRGLRLGCCGLESGRGGGERAQELRCELFGVARALESPGAAREGRQLTRSRRPAQPRACHSPVQLAWQDPSTLGPARRAGGGKAPGARCAACCGWLAGGGCRDTVRRMRGQRGAVGGRGGLRESGEGSRRARGSKEARGASFALLEKDFPATPARAGQARRSCGGAAPNVRGGVVGRDRGQASSSAPGRGADRGRAAGRRDRGSTTGRR